ncbi:MAG: DUF1735 domain-containing protein [Bacteroidales bacterium]|nr:DUF1735 domain-containing protein [Bacteroidales bacterium]
MKNLYKYISVSMLAVAAGFTSCHNGDIEFDDYEGGVSVYFPYQTPVRVLVMGEDTYNTDLDNAHKCKISGTMGGAYNGKNIKVDIAVDESLCENLYKEDGVTPIKAMPASYYSLSSSTLDYNGNYTGSVEVTFSDEFFADPNSVAGNYVIPVVMKSQTGADRIIAGTYDTEIYSAAPSRLSDNWNDKPMDYTLFCVRYISKYEGFFLRGITSENGTAKTREAGKTCIDDPIVYTKTVGLNKVIYGVEKETGTALEAGGKKYQLVLTFDDSQNCTVSAPEGVDYTATGSGNYGDHSEKLAWGNKDRDGLHLNYTVTIDGNNYSFEETLVLQRRGVKKEDFKYVVK